jgi:hypothetical protein
MTSKANKVALHIYIQKSLVPFASGMLEGKEKWECLSGKDT